MADEDAGMLVSVLGESAFNHVPFAAAFSQ
jgi:hypothetical protein